MKKKNALALVALALLLVALMAGCRRAKPAVVSDVDVTPTTAAAVATGRTVVPVASSTPTPEGTPETTPTPSPEAATPTPTTAADTTPTAAPTSTPVPTTVPTPVPTEAAPSEKTHVVQAGENLFRIALHYGMSHQALAAANGIINPDLINIGQRLTIPAEGTAPTVPTGAHVVQPGENLFRIALRYGVTVETLAVTNGISNVNLIHPGQRLAIP